MNLFKKLYELQSKRAIDVFAQAAYLTDKDARVFYVDSVHGSADYGGRTMSGACATLTQAHGLCTANNHDTIVMLPRHAETTSSVLTLNKAGVSIIGLKQGNLRPTLTFNAAADNLSVEAANVSIQGVKFNSPSTDAQTAHINIAGAFCEIRDVRMLGSETSNNMVNCITITADGDDVLIDDLRIDNTVVEVVGAILFEGAFTRGTFNNIRVHDTIGFTNGAIYDAAAATGVEITNCFFQNAKAATAVVKFANNSVGFMNHVGIAGRHTTIASNMDPGTSMDLMNVKVAEEAIKTGMDYDVDAD